MNVVEFGRFENRSISRHDSCLGSVRLARFQKWKKISRRKLSEEIGCSATNFKSANLNENQIAADKRPQVHDPGGELQGGARVGAGAGAASGENCVPGVNCKAPGTQPRRAQSGQSLSSAPLSREPQHGGVRGLRS